MLTSRLDLCVGAIHGDREVDIARITDKRQVLKWPAQVGDVISALGTRARDRPALERCPHGFVSNGVDVAKARGPLTGVRHGSSAVRREADFGQSCGPASF